MKLSEKSQVQDVWAWVPEDFNLDVHIEGNINGVNMKDTKLISKNVSFITEGRDSSVSARRLRNDMCTIKTNHGSVSIGSYIETGELDLQTESGNI
jgi:hypothetical protein